MMLSDEQKTKFDEIFKQKYKNNILVLNELFPDLIKDFDLNEFKSL